jgi:hypothetical protein
MLEGGTMVRRVALLCLALAALSSIVALPESVAKFMERMEESYVSACTCSCLEGRIELSLTYEGVVYGATEGSCDLATYAAQKWLEACGQSFAKPTCALSNNSIQNDIAASCTTAIASAAIASGKNQLTTTEEALVGLLASHEDGNPVAVTIHAFGTPPVWFPPEAGFGSSLPPQMAAGDAFMGFYYGGASIPGETVRVIVVGSPCALSGMKAKDIILTIAGQRVHKSGDHIPVLALRRPGEYVIIMLNRDGDILYTVLQLVQTP